MRHPSSRRETTTPKFKLTVSLSGNAKSARA
jgi:hypothetical protein